MPITLVGLAVQSVGLDTGVLVGGLTLAFATQTVLGWMKITSLQVDVKGLRNDMGELQNLHPRKGNPGERLHDPEQFCPNPKCLTHVDPHSRAKRDS